MGRGVPLPLDRVLWPSTDVFVNFWFKIGHFCSEFFVFRQKVEGTSPSAPPLNAPLHSAMRYDR